MNCAECKATVPVGGQFCAACGTPVSNAAPLPVAQAVPVGQPVVQHQDVTPTFVQATPVVMAQPPLAQNVVIIDPNDPDVKRIVSPPVDGIAHALCCCLWGGFWVPCCLLAMCDVGCQYPCGEPGLVGRNFQVSYVKKSSTTTRDPRY